MRVWDYKIKKGWKPQNERQWVWYLERKINYDDWRGLQPEIIRKYFSKLKLDEGKRLIFKAYFDRYGKKARM